MVNWDSRLLIYEIYNHYLTNLACTPNTLVVIIVCYFKTYTFHKLKRYITHNIPPVLSIRHEYVDVSFALQFAILNPYTHIPNTYTSTQFSREWCDLTSSIWHHFDIPPHITLSNNLFAPSTYKSRLNNQGLTRRCNTWGDRAFVRQSL